MTDELDDEDDDDEDVVELAVVEVGLEDEVVDDDRDGVKRRV